MLQLKSISRERDTAVATLAQIKSAGSQREGQIKMSVEIKQNEIDALKKK